MLREKNRKEITRFIQEFFIEKKGLYTLAGEKPITSEILHHYDDDDHLAIKKFVDDHPDLEFKQIDRNIETDWPVWKDQIKSLNMNNFIFSEIHPCHLGEKESVLIFLNVSATLECLRIHFELFKQELKQNFSPREVIEDLKSGRLDFWNRVFENQKLEGIVLGFGPNNSRLFQLAISKRKTDPCNESIAFPSPPLDSGKSIRNQTLFLPSFACMDPKESSQILEKYNFTRNQIISECQNQRIEEYVLKKLFSTD